MASDDIVTVGTSISDDIVHRLHGLMVGTSEATEGALSSHPAPPPAPANNAVDLADLSTQTTRRLSTTYSSSYSKAPACSNNKVMARKLEALRRRRRFDRRRPSADSITDELQNLTVTRGGAAAFRPTAEEFVGLFLRPRIAGRALPRAARFVHDADVYANAPDHLAAIHAPAPCRPGAAAAARSWYFFSPLHFQAADPRTPCRRVGNHGVWRWTGSKRKLEIDGGEAAHWHVRCLHYCDLRSHGNPSNASSWRMEWQMREYTMTHQDSGRQHPLVLCEVYKKEMPPSYWSHFE